MTSENDEQTPEELAAHYGPGGPVAPASAFLDAVLRDEDFVMAWKLLDREFRLVRAQAWLWNNREHEGLVGVDLDRAAAALTDDEPSDALWLPFAMSELEQLLEAWEAYDLETIGAASQPRPIGLGLEIVMFLPTEDGILQFPEATLVDNALIFVMRQSERGWRHRGLRSRPTDAWVAA